MASSRDKSSATHDARRGQDGSDRTGKIDERRRYFRITDDAIVKYQVLSDPVTRSADGSSWQLISAGASGAIRNPELAMSRISDQYPDVAHYLRHLDRRVKELFQFIVLQEIEANLEVALRVSLSGGGLAFYSAAQIDVGTRLRIKLLLVSSFTVMLLNATCVRSERRKTYLPTHPYKIAVEFDDINEEQRDLLIKHVLARQAQQLRNAKS